MAEGQKDNNNFIWLYHNNKLVKTIKEFMEREYIYGITPDEFFSVNKELIFQQYSEKDKENEKKRSGKWPESANDISVDSLLPYPCKLKINPNKILAEIAITQTNAQIDTSDFYAFAYEKIQNILQDEGYKIDSTTKRNVDCQVFGWFKSMYQLGLSQKKKQRTYMGKGYDSEFADLSRYVISLATSVTANGGSFTMRLPVISSRSSGVSIMVTDDKINNGEQDVVGSFGRGSKDTMIYNFGKERSDFFAKSSFNDIESNYFNWLISSNDLIFISFEKLEMELKRNPLASGDSDNFDIETAISSGIYDMIGLVDDVKVVSDSSSSTAYVEVTGRDLMKLLIEDGSFFFNPSTTSFPSAVFVNEQSYGKQGDIREADIMNNTYNNPINRLRNVTGELNIFINRINMDISYVLKAIMSQLANVEIVPSYVFDSWGDDRTKYIELEPKKEK